jgi:hypothetical protein
VDAGLIALFGAPLSPTGQEDRVFVIADASTHASLTAQSGYEFLASVEDIYIHTRPLVPTTPIGAR